MFSTADQQNILGGFNQVLDLMGVPAVWHQAKSPAATKNVQVGFTVATIQDEAIVNAYGIGTRIITVKATDLPSLEKFDRFDIQGEMYTLAAAQPLHVNGVLAFYQGFAKGK